MPSGKTGWDHCPGQLQKLTECAPLVAEGELTWREVATLVSALGPPRSNNACQLRWARHGGTPEPPTTDDLTNELEIATAELKYDRAVWEQERAMVIRETARVRKENTRLMALNNVVIRTFKEAVLRMPTFEVRPWEVRPPGRDQCANLVISDAHGGATQRPEDVANLNAYSWEEMLRRADVLVDSSLSICEGQRRGWPLSAMNLLCAGDLVTGEDIYVGQSRDIDRILVDQIIQMAEVVVQKIILPFLDFFPTVRMYAAWGNHGRLGQKKGQKHKRSNADYLLYHFIRQRLLEVERFECYISQSPIIGFSVPEAPDYNVLMTHGERVKRYMSIPYYGLKRWTMRMIGATGVFWHYVVMGHHHTHAQIDASHGEMLINGAWVGPTDFALDVLQDTAPGKQLLFGMHPEHGITWRYPVWMSPRPQMVQDPVSLLYTPVYEEGKSYSMRP